PASSSPLTGNERITSHEGTRLAGLLSHSPRFSLRRSRHQPLREAGILSEDHAALPAVASRTGLPEWSLRDRRWPWPAAATPASRCRLGPACSSPCCLSGQCTDVCRCPRPGLDNLDVCSPGALTAPTSPSAVGLVGHARRSVLSALPASRFRVTMEWDPVPAGLAGFEERNALG